MTRDKPENLSSRSSPIMISSMRSHRPSFTDSGMSKVDTISPPTHNGLVSLHNNIKVKRSVYSYLWKSISQLRSVTCRMGSHSVTFQGSTRHKRTHPAFTPARHQAGTRFTDHLRMEGWVSPGPECKEQLAHGCYATARASETRTHELAITRLSRHPSDVITRLQVDTTDSLSDHVAQGQGKTETTISKTKIISSKNKAKTTAIDHKLQSAINGQSKQAA